MLMPLKAFEISFVIARLVFPISLTTSSHTLHILPVVLVNLPHPPIGENSHLFHPRNPHAPIGEQVHRTSKLQHRRSATQNVHIILMRRKMAIGHQTFKRFGNFLYIVVRTGASSTCTTRWMNASTMALYLAVFSPCMMTRVRNRPTRKEAARVPAPVVSCNA